MDHRLQSTEVREDHFGRISCSLANEIHLRRRLKLSRPQGQQLSHGSLMEYPRRSGWITFQWIVFCLTNHIAALRSTFLGLRSPAAKQVIFSHGSLSDIHGGPGGSDRLLFNQSHCRSQIDVLGLRSLAGRATQAIFHTDHLEEVHGGPGGSLREDHFSFDQWFCSNFRAIAWSVRLYLKYYFGSSI